jgi:DNA replication and repair protein RecF
MSRLARLSVTHLRIVDHADLDLDGGINLITGPNGHGKTTLLEAVTLAALGRLWRGGRDGQAVATGHDQASVKAVLDGAGAEVSVVLPASGRKRVLLNGSSLTRPSDIMGRLPVVGFNAFDLEIARGGPAERRAFLDAELSQLSLSYLKAFASYKRALTQRAALLKQARDHFVPGEMFEPWEEALAASGTVLRQMRREWVEDVAADAAADHAALSGGERLEMRYTPADEAACAEGLAASRGRDIARGSTSFGPHRDNLELMLNGLDVRIHGSQGQQRTAVIALKCSVFRSVEERFEQAPMLLLDDVFSDLDESRRERLMSLALERGSQVMLTCTEPALAGEKISQSAKVFRVDSGQVRG